MLAGKSRLGSADFLDDLIDFLCHNRLPTARNLRRIHTENIFADPPEHGIIPAGAAAAERKDPRYHDACSDGRPMIVHAYAAQLPYDVYDCCGVRSRNSGFSIAI